MIKVFKNEITAKFVPRSIIALVAAVESWQHVEKCIGYRLNTSTAMPYSGGMTFEQERTFYRFNDMYRGEFDAQAVKYLNNCPDTLAELAEMYNKWLAQNQLPSMSADCLIMDETISLLQYVTLEWFLTMWDIANNHETA